MREIKFRAWDPDEKVMMYDDETAAHKMGYWDGVNTSPISMINTQLKEDSLIPDIYMQYTGLKDANGIEIYEGDIVKTTQHIGGNFVDNIYNQYQVIFSGFSFQLQSIPEQLHTTSLHLGDDTEIEVIGNCHENPELLKGA